MLCVTYRPGALRYGGILPFVVALLDAGRRVDTRPPSIGQRADQAQPITTKVPPWGIEPQLPD